MEENEISNKVTGFAIESYRHFVAFVHSFVLLVQKNKGKRDS